MKEKVHEDGTKAAKTPSMIYYAKLKDNMMLTRPWQNEHQRSVNDWWSCIIGNLRGDWLLPFINAVLAGIIGKRERHMLPAPLCKWMSTDCQRILVL